MNLPRDASKPLILIFPFDLLSHYLRCLEIAKSLTDKFDIRFAHSNSYSRFVKEQGFESFECKNFDAAEVTKCSEKFDFSWLNEKVLEDILYDQERCIREWRPEIVFGDVSPTLKMAAEKTGLPYISLMNGYISKYYSYVRKISSAHPAYKYSKKLPEKIFDVITGIAESIAFRRVHKPFKRIRKKNNLSRKKQYLDELEGELNLICDLEEIFPQLNLPANYKIISPLFHSSNADAIGLTEKLDRSKNTIFVSMGSSGNWSKVSFLNNAYFSKFNVVAAGDKSAILNAEHILKFTFINVDEIFPSTDLVICHGGNGTIYQALSYGIPVLCKTAHFEQEWNAYGFEKYGVSRSLNDSQHFEDAVEIIEEWIERKDSEKLIYVKNKIKAEKLKLKKMEFVEDFLKLIAANI